VGQGAGNRRPPKGAAPEAASPAGSSQLGWRRRLVASQCIDALFFFSQIRISIDGTVLILQRHSLIFASPYIQGASSATPCQHDVAAAIGRGLGTYSIDRYVSRHFEMQCSSWPESPCPPKIPHVRSLALEAGPGATNR
jgi:hypothetical protein